LRKILLISIWIYLLTSAAGANSFIVLSQQKERALIDIKKQEYIQILKSNPALNKLAPNISYEKIHDRYILKVGPFSDEENMVVAYFSLKKIYPLAFRIKDKYSSEPTVKTVIKKVIVEKVKIRVVEREPEIEADQSLWIAIFGLATIGILFMYLSSDKIKRLSERHKKIQEKHKNLEDKQNEILLKMGENIHSIAEKTAQKTSHLAEKAKETILSSDIENMMHSENELMDVANDLIKFLQLKSKRVEINHQVFYFNNLLNELTGMLNHTFKRKGVEFVFDIDNSVPDYMLGDTLHLGQILNNLLEYSMEGSSEKIVRLNVSTISGFTKSSRIIFKIYTDFTIEDKDNLFEPYYDEDAHTYLGLGLFVARKLSTLMDGGLLIEDDPKDEGSVFTLTLPLESSKEANNEPHKSLLDKTSGKKVFIVDSNLYAAQAAGKIMEQANCEVTVVSEEVFKQKKPTFIGYDIVILGLDIFNEIVEEHIRILHIRNRDDLLVIALGNIFNIGEDFSYSHIIDINIKKPLTKELVFDALLVHYGIKDNLIEVDSKKEGSNKLLIHRESFENIPNISLDSFTSFSGKRILIVEDNTINQRVILGVLDKSGMDIVIANNGKEAIDILKREEKAFDFVLMDINMPIMDGYTATLIIRQDSRFDTLPVVSLTALTSEHEVSKMFEVGMNGFLPKPVYIERLFDAFSKFMNKELLDKHASMITSDKDHIDYNGLNIKTGLKSSGGNSIFYKEILNEFIEAYGNSDILYKKLVEQRRYEQLKALCIDMRGLTGTIGAKEMHDLILEIHQYLLYGKYHYLSGYVERYHSELSKLLKSIKSYMKA